MPLRPRPLSPMTDETDPDQFSKPGSVRGKGSPDNAPKISNLLRRVEPIDARSLPSLGDIERAVQRIHDRWPEAVKVPDDRDRDALSREMLARVKVWHWGDMKMSRVLSAAMAVFDADRRNRQDLAPVRRFFLDEIAASGSETFLGGMARVYIDSFAPDADATRSLGACLHMRQRNLGGRLATLTRALPDVFNPETAPRSIAVLMAKSDAPYAALRSVGFRSPHSHGLTLAAHPDFVAMLSPELSKPAAQDRLLAWIDPPGAAALETGGALAVGALLRPWVEREPGDDLRGKLSERIIAAYGDPRLQNGGIWSGFDPVLKRVMLRWLTGQDMKFFCDMVTVTQPNHMWPPRRDFWLALFKEKRITEAWVAFGSSARAYAQRNLVKHGGTNTARRFGRQLDRSQSTSLLIMRIGNKIVVDGCHSYKTHIFRADDPKAPKLYEGSYYCDSIRFSSTNSKSHNSIPNWQEWVLRHV